MYVPVINNKNTANRVIKHIWVAVNRIKSYIKVYLKS